MIEAAIYLNRIEVPGDQRESVELCASSLWIDFAPPVGIRPTGRTDMNISESAHASDFVRQTSVCRYLARVPLAAGNADVSSALSAQREQDLQGPPQGVRQKD